MPGIFIGEGTIAQGGLEDESPQWGSQAKPLQKVWGMKTPEVETV